jgi:hypothetical protein
MFGKSDEGVDVDAFRFYFELTKLKRTKPDEYKKFLEEMKGVMKDLMTIGLEVGQEVYNEQLKKLPAGKEE